MKRLFLALLLLCACATKRTGLMPWPDQWPQWPYIVEVPCGAGQLYYFGARHTNDSTDSQVRQIEDAWQGFRPDIAFNEGGSPPYEASAENAVRRSGEAGLVRFLAMRDDIPVTSIDPTRAEEVALLSRKFTREQVKLFFLMRSAMQFIERNGTAGVDAEMERILKIFDGMPGLRGLPRTVDDIRDLYPRYPNVSRDDFDPAKRGTLFNEIARAGSEFRDRHMIDLVVRHLREGHRVFAVAGGSHVYMQEPAIRSACGSTPHSIQP
jgi:hypothetical protein